MDSVDDLSPDEREAYELIVDEGEFVQSELWKALDTTSRKGSRLAKALAEKGLIERTETTHEGRVSYLLTPTDGGVGGSAGDGTNPTASDGDGTEDESLTGEEERALSMIKERGGLYQSELWKALDATSRAGSRLARSLAEKGRIERVETTHEGRVTYRLTPMEGTTTTVSWEGSESGPIEEPDEPDELDEREERALELIRDRGGMYQSELWKALDVTSRTGSRIATRLEERELIRRIDAVHGGQRTYYLLPAKRDLDFSLLMAGDQMSPLVGGDDIDPIDSQAFSQWVLQLAHQSE